MNCKICNHESLPFAQGRVLDKYNVQYFQCANCNFIQTENPYWLSQAYSSAITTSDLGLVTRNLSFVAPASALISMIFGAQGSFLDFGGGYGMFVRLMRDAGYNFYRQDMFCENLFAKGFDISDKRLKHFQLVTAFEVFEHLVDPIAEIEQMLSYSRNILFSTLLLPQPIPSINQWWYFGLEHGQHVSLYSKQTLNVLAQKFGLNCYSNGRTLHLLTARKLSRPLMNLVLDLRAAKILKLFLRRASLLPQDFLQLTGHTISN